MSTESETQRGRHPSADSATPKEPGLDELSARITATATRLSETVAELKVELQPEQIKQRATTKIKASINAALREETGEVKPIVLAVGAAGIALIGFTVVWKVTHRR